MIYTHVWLNHLAVYLYIVSQLYFNKICALGKKDIQTSEDLNIVINHTLLTKPSMKKLGHN